MRASIFSQYGSPELLTIKEVERPVPKNKEVQIKVHAASVNSWDWELLNGKPFANRVMFGIFKPKKIQSLGCDVAGVVSAIGKNVTSLTIGDEVFGDLSADSWGGFAEYTCAPESSLTRKPENMSFEQAAAIPQAGLLAYQALHYKKGVQAGQKVLINGAGGGVGSFSIPLAKALGAEVTAVDRSDKLEHMQAWGADHVIDHCYADFANSTKKYELILDVVAHHSLSDYHSALTESGQFVLIGGSMSLVRKLYLHKPFNKLNSKQNLDLLLHKANHGLTEMCQLFEQDVYRPIIDKVYNLEQVPEALRYCMGGNAIGKILINL